MNADTLRKLAQDLTYKQGMLVNEAADIIDALRATLVAKHRWAWDQWSGTPEHVAMREVQEEVDRLKMLLKDSVAQNEPLRAEVATLRRQLADIFADDPLQPGAFVSVENAPVRPWWRFWWSN